MLYVVGAADSVLIPVMSLIRSVLYRMALLNSTVFIQLMSFVVPCGQPVAFPLHASLRTISVKFSFLSSGFP